MTQILINGIVLSANYALIATGLTLIFGIMNILNFAHGQMYMIGGFVVYYLFGLYGFPYYMALAAAGVVVGIVGILCELLFRRVLTKTTREENSMMLAVGTALLLESAALLVFGEKQRGVPPLIEGVIFLEYLGAYIPRTRLLVFFLASIIIAALLLFVQYTRTGRALRALAQDKEASALMGINVNKMTSIGFAVGAALAGLTGGLLVTFLSVNSGVGTSISIKAFVMIMIGGAGVVSGAIIGAVVLAFAESIGYAVFSGSQPYLIIFVAVIIFLIFRPNGIIGKPWG